MALTVQQVIDDANIAVRHYFADPGSSVSGSDATIMIPFVNWTHQDVLHTSPTWSTYILTSEVFTSAVNGSPYILTANNIRRIIQVYDVRNRRIVIPYHDINFPTGTGIPQEKSGPPRDKLDETNQTNAHYPQYYIVENCITQADGTVVQGMHLFSDPHRTSDAGTIRYFYSKVVTQLTAVGDNLVIPEDGRDIVVAGVAMHASRFLKRPQDAEMWRGIYEGMKRGF